ncbi:p53-like transcription factor [Backusella circina FSU 941]|nr:p53-like transcription factor [Backusella circina FSU 941]
MDRGFFVSQNHWTCYRRNYFQVTTSLTIPGFTDQTYALQLNERMQPIRGFFLRLKACTSHVEEQDNSTIRPIALTQMTPKRDKGPQREPPIMPITPADNVFSSEQVGVTFERLQFRVATANNGKRRASQQYFRLVFELIAELPDGSQHTISECFSSPLVVRGRSPGHYSNDLQQTKKKRKLSPSVVLPPPQYVYASPPMVESNVVSPASTTTSLNSSTPIPYTSVHPGYLNSAFHNRSQSANDTEFFSRNRALRYMVEDHHHQQHPQQQQQHLHHHHQQSEPLYEQFEVARALRNWQQQVIRQRTDSGATFDSYMSNDSQRQERPNEPYPIQFPSYLHHSNSWTTATAAAVFRPDDKSSYSPSSSGSPKMYQNTAPSS